jgi:rhamnose utilization protein RhaD (predicted bifunctional aldolase and dehydrogenase)
MVSETSTALRTELERLAELTARVGGDALLTQGSTGNSSIKLDGVLWIKASGKWMADALDQDIQIPLDLAAIRSQCLQQNIDPATRYPEASLETAMHAVLPHRVVLHVHCVHTIAWAVRQDAADQLQCQLQGLRWQFIPYTASGLPLAKKIQSVVSRSPQTDIWILGNHGLVVGGADCQAVAAALAEVRERLGVAPRPSHPADYAALMELAEDSPWELPDDDEVHALATDATSQAILARGLLYPCQAIFSEATTPELFRPIPCPYPGDAWRRQYADRPFLMIEGRGVMVRRDMTAAELAMAGGLARVVQRIPASASLRYLSDVEIAETAGAVARSYRELANGRIGATSGQVMSSRA